MEIRRKVVLLSVALGVVGCQYLPVGNPYRPPVADAGVGDSDEDPAAARAAVSRPASVETGTLTVRINFKPNRDRGIQAKISDIAYLDFLLQGPTENQIRRLEVAGLSGDASVTFPGLPSGAHQLKVQARTTSEYLIGESGQSFQIEQGKTSQANLQLTLIPDDGAVSAVVSIVEPGPVASPTPPPSVGDGNAAPPQLSLPPFRHSVIAGSGQEGFQDGLASDASFTSPIGTALDANGNLYVLDYDRIRKVTPDGLVTTVAQSSSFVDAEWSGRTAAVDDQGNIYVFQHIGCKIQRVSPDGEVSDFVGSGSPGYADGQGTNAQFNRISGMARLSNGSFLVTDYWNQMIRTVSAEGVVSRFSGSGSPGSVDGAAAEAQFSEPHGGTLDSQGRYWFVDHYQARVRYVDPDGRAHTLRQSDGLPVDYGWGWAALPNVPGVGTLLSGGSDGVALFTEATGLVPYIGGNEFQGRYPSMVYHPSGQVWLVDRGNRCIRRIEFL